jgi:metal-responsive CopG/Arc/MetJ family transcriptional regulator
MKVKTSITLSKTAMAMLDRLAQNSSRSAVVEAAVVEYAERRLRAARDLRDIQILNDRAGALNEEVEDALRYQAEL